MTKHYFRQLTASILLWAYSFQILAGMVIPINLAPEQPANTEYAVSNVPTAADSKMGTSEMLNALALDSERWGLQGPLTFGANYDTLLGMIYDAQYTNKITDKSAFSVIGEYGANQARANGTLGFQLYPDGLIKFTGEYLSQTLPFTFDSGDINQEVTQNAYGFDFQHNVNHMALKNINFGGYYAKAPNVSLSTVNYFDEYGIEYINQRNLAGATTQGLDFGGSLQLTPMTSIDLTLNYDDIVYNTELTDDTYYNDSGIGGTFQINQLIGERMLFSANTEFRPIYNSYGLELSYAPAFAKTIGLQVGLFAEHLMSSNETPDSNIYGLQLSFLGDDAGKAPNYGINVGQGNMDVLDWVKNPAVYMERVLIMSEQITTIANPVTINLMYPTSGPFEGGNTLTIYGVGFVPETQVFFNGTPGIVTFISSTEISVIVPSAIQAKAVSIATTTITTPVDVVVTNPNGDSFDFDIQYTYTTGPTLVSLTPTSGPTLGGTAVTLTGTNFTGTTSVTFGGIAANSFSVVSDTTVTGVAPANLAGAADVILTTSDGSSTLSNGFTYTASDNPPTITSVAPNEGVSAGGTSVVITGTNFVGASAVNFGSTAASSFTMDTPQQITAVSPAGSGTMNITVTTPVGTSATSSADQFTYHGIPTVSEVSPNQGPLTGDTSVTISGTNFTSGSTVFFGASAASSVTYNSATSLTAVSPSGSGTVDITVTTIGGTSATSSADAYTYFGIPTVTGVSPTMGEQNGGDSVTITGTNFTGASNVSFGTTSATSFIVDSDIQITAVTPFHVGGVINVTVTNPVGTSETSSADEYGFYGVPSITSVAPNAGPTAGGTSVIIAGVNFSQTTQVYFGSTPATSFIVSNSTHITAISPAGSEGTVDVTISNPLHTSVISSADQFTYTAVPTVTEISPSSGPLAGSTSVTITGTGFTSSSTVAFGGSAGTSVSVISSTSLTAVSPSGSAGTVHITVTTAGGASAASSADQFIYTSSPLIDTVSPSSGLNAGGTSVTITGGNFTGVTAVTFGDTDATSFTVNSDTQITAVSPQKSLTSGSSSSTVDIAVTNSNGTVTKTNAYTYNRTYIIFVTSSSYNGNLSGFSGANTKCTNDINKPSATFTSNYTYKALLNNNTATNTGGQYYRTDGSTLIATATGGNLVGAAAIVNSISSSGSSSNVWTGATVNGTTNNCKNWTLSSNNDYGRVGLDNSPTAAWYSSATPRCNTSAKLYCVSQ